MLKRFSCLTLIFLITACASTNLRPAQSVRAVSIMAYNVENLFDTKPDPNREDFTFLPLTLKGTPEHRLACSKQESVSRRQECLEKDWNDDLLNRKLDRLADVILSVNNGRGPDVLVMAEVENINALNLLNSRLKAAQYTSVILEEGPDLRGIDIAMLSRLPMAKPPVLHKIPFKPKTPEDKEWMARTRGILQGSFRLPNGDTLHVFGVHLPSQANPTYWREQAIDFLNELKNKLPPTDLAVAGGDFNISAEEDSKTNLFRERLGKQWLVSHYIGCGDCVGTHNYRGTWSFLDALLFAPSLGPDGTAKWRVDAKSIHVVKGSRYQTSQYLTPERFNGNKPVGVSDHYPIIGEIHLRD